MRIYAPPDQEGAVKRHVTVRMRAADGPTHPFRLSADGGTVTGEVGTDTLDAQIDVCVPAGAFADVRLDVSGSSTVYGDPESSVTAGEPRRAGVQVVQVALADEIGGSC